jgi:predicted DNA-binding transcriptional regulator AlpA
LQNDQSPRELSIEPAALDARRSAEFVGVSRAHWMRQCAAGNTPAGVRLGARRLWARAELEAWLLAGCPSRAQWERRHKP